MMWCVMCDVMMCRCGLWPAGVVSCSQWRTHLRERRLAEDDGGGLQGEGALSGGRSVGLPEGGEAVGDGRGLRGRGRHPLSKRHLRLQLVVQQLAQDVIADHRLVVRTCWQEVLITLCLSCLTKLKEFIDQLSGSSCSVFYITSRGVGV